MNSSVNNTDLPQLKIAAIADFCTRWKITELALFGSVPGPEFTRDSDIDLLVTFAYDTKWGLFDHARMQQELQDILGHDVDLVSRRAVERSANWLRRDEILRTAHVLFPVQEVSHGSG